MAAMDGYLKKAGCLAPLLVSALVPVHAASILAVDPLVSGLGDGTDASATFETGAENNDSAPGSPADGARDLRNTLTVDKTMGQLVGGAEPYIDLVFTIETVFDGVLGITEYAVTETLTNNTGTGFNGFVLQLGFGTGEEFLPIFRQTMTASSSIKVWAASIRRCPHRMSLPSARPAAIRMN